MSGENSVLWGLSAETEDDAGMIERCLQFQLGHAVRLVIFSQQSQPAFVVRPESFFSSNAPIFS
jgi:hypothetical protein